jgi:hypothetical protein
MLTWPDPDSPTGPYPDRPVRDGTGGLRKHGSWWNYEPAAQIERVRVGNSPPNAACAVFLSQVGRAPGGQCLYP